LIKYDPRKMLQKIAPEKKVKRLLSSKVSVKKTALAFLDDVDFLSKSKVAKVALNTVKDYKARIKAGTVKKSQLVDDPKQLIQRVQNEVVLQISQEIRQTYLGEFYIWLPSDAEVPDPEHQLNYGKKFQIGDGEQPGDRFGCRCGMQILVDEKQLNL
jgi:hypothetical protein